MERIGVPPGTEIGGYRVLSPLGQGGMGAVYRAVDGAGTVVALKLLHPHLGADADARERLRREVAHLQRVRHPGVARVLDAEIDSAEAFIVTELVEGKDLEARVRARGPLTPAELVELAEQLRSALDVVHGAGVLHRDLSPGNVLVTAHGAVLIDFGIAQTAGDARVTSTGLVIGTPGYLSPELLEGGEPSTAGDWWGWAALLAFAATGRPPFGARPLHTVLAKARAGDADLEGLDRRTGAALRSALAVDPRHRATPDQVVVELRRAASGDTDGGVGLGAAAATQVLGAGGAFAGATAATALVTGDGGTRVLGADRLDGAAGPRLDDPDATAALPVPPPGSGPGPDGSGPYADPDDPDAGYDDEAYDEAYYDAYDDRADDGLDEGGADEDPDDAGPPAYVSPVARRRVGTVLALAAPLLALGAVRPGVALAIAAGLAVLLRTVGRAVEGFHRRRARRGARRGDLAAVLAATPWYLGRSVLGVLPALLVALSVVVVVGGVAWWLVDTGRWVVAAPPDGQAAGELAGNASWVTPVLVGGVALLGLLTLWFGPMSRTTRDGTRWTLAAVAPDWIGATTVIVLALAAAVVLALTVPGQDIVWWPLTGPPDLR